MEKQLFTVAVPRTITLSASTAFLIAVLLCPAVARAQEPPPVPGAPAVVPEETRMLMAGTPIRVRLPEAVRSGKLRKGDTVRFLVAEAVRSPDGRTVLVPAGAQAEGVVRESASGGRFGQAGHIIVQGEHVLLPEGTRVPLRPDVKGSPAARGRGRGLMATGTGVLTGTVVGAGVLAAIFTSGTTFSSDKDSGGLGLLGFVAVVGSGYLGASSIRGGEASLRRAQNIPSLSLRTRRFARQRRLLPTRG
jgi:type IV secretory pathway VirB10-like protein